MESNRLLDSLRGARIAGAAGGDKKVSPVQQIQIDSLRTLMEQHDNIIKNHEENVEVHEKFRSDYVSLRDHLRRIGDKLEHEALVPLGPKVLVMGKIVHTNEITCLLGDNWFVECTAKKAVEIVNHRIKKCDEMLQKLKKEGDLLESWKSETERLLEESMEEGAAEIVEEYDEEKEKRWKQEHREKVRKYYQESAKKRKELEETEAALTEEEEMWKRLDELELEESLNRKNAETRFADDSPISNPVPAPVTVPNKSKSSKEPKPEKVKGSSKPTNTSVPASKMIPNPDLASSKSLVNIVESTAARPTSVPVGTVVPEVKRISKFKQSRQQ